MADAIATFWTWWKTARKKIDAALISRDLAGLDAEITKRVQAIDPDLKWEVGGEEGKPGFALSWDGGLARRRLVERWHAKAPKPPKTSKTGGWTYHAGRPAGGWRDLVMSFGKFEIDFGKFVCTFKVDADRERVDLVVFHPSTTKAPENVRVTSTFVMLDRAFGEDGVERWIGDVLIAPKKPRGALPIDKLVAAVGKLAKKSTRDVCILSQGEIDGAPTFVLENKALKAIDHLACDQQLAVEIAYAATESGLPTKTESTALDALEEALTAAVPDLAFHSRETSAGARTLYYFAPAAVEKKVAAWAKKQKRKIVYAIEADPDWRGLDRWRGHA